LFSTFPHGSPGFGLLILRAALGLTVLFQSARQLFEFTDSAFLNWFAGFFAVAAGVFLLVGFLTPVISTIILAAAILSLAAGQNSGVIIEIYAIILSAAVALLGPGAFSLDARLFGRREIVIPKNASNEGLF